MFHPISLQELSFMPMSDPESLTILMIDDSESDYLIASAFLVKALPYHCQVDWVATFQEGLQRLKTHPPDLALIDYFLETGNGVDLIRQARQQGCQVPLILLTAREDYQTDLEAMRAGVDEYLVKGQFEPVALERVIRYVLKDYRQRQEILKLNQELEERVQNRTSELIMANFALQESERRLELLKEVASIANADLETGEVILQTLNCISQYTGWPLGHAALVQDQTVHDEVALIGSTLWHDLAPERHLSLRELSQKRNADKPHLKQVLTHRKPIASDFSRSDFTQQPLAQAALACGLPGLIVFPVMLRKQVVAVLEFFSYDPLELSAEMSRLLQEVGVQLAFVIERKQNEAMLKHMREAAESANQAKSAFLASMSHEIRTPMNAILGFAQILLRDPELTAGQRAYLGTILRSGEHLLGLINDVLEMSKIESGHISLNPHAFDLHQLLQDVQSMFSEKFKLSGLSLDVVLAENLPRFISSDESKIRQVLINLLSNAVKFTEAGGVSIRLRADSSQQMLFCEVEDTGVGIAPAEQEKVFQSFEQTSSGIRSQSGTGLGMSISKSYVELMGGQLSLRSELGRGTCFYFHLRYELAEATEVIQKQMEQRIMGLDPSQPSPSILVVDDQPDNRRLLHDMLRPLGFSIMEAQNGQEALNAFEQHQPDAILMDAAMPVMDGLEATRLIRLQTLHKQPLIISISASAFDHNRAAVISSGADDFVPKPVREQELLSKLQQYLDLKYTYAEPPSESALAESKVFSQHDLPADMLQAMREALDSGDLEQVEELAQSLSAEQPALAEKLVTWAQNFDYEQLTTFLAEAA